MRLQVLPKKVARTKVDPGIQKHIHGEQVV